MNFKRTLILFIVLFVIVSLCSLFVSFPVWILYVLVLFFLLMVSMGSFVMRFNFFLKSYTGSKENRNKTVALTFDDGPNPTYTPIVLKLLKEYNATATFFCIGKQIEKYPELFQQIVAAGHTIGNHSFSHKTTIGFNGTKCWIREIESTDSIINKLLHKKPKLFRPPYGVTTPHLAKAIALTNHTVVGWNVRPFDTSVIRVKHPVLKHIQRKVQSGAIILLHDTHERIPYILEHTLIYLQEHGYKTVSVNTFIDEK